MNEETMKSSPAPWTYLYQESQSAHAVDTLHLNGISVFTAEMNSVQKYLIPIYTTLLRYYGNEEKGVQHFK